MRNLLAFVSRITVIVILAASALRCGSSDSGSRMLESARQTDPAQSSSPTTTDSSSSTSIATSVEGSVPNQVKQEGYASTIEQMSDQDKIRFFATVSDAVYCGDGSSCTLLERLSHSQSYVETGYNLNDWKINLLTARDGQKDVEGYLFSRPDANDVIIAFRGSESPESMGSFQDWMNDLDFSPQYVGGKAINGEVHRGFLTNLQGIWHPNNTGIIKVLTDEKLWNKRFWLTGHSLGGAIATLVGMRLADEGKAIAGIYTYGSPKLAKWNFQGSYNAKLKSVTRNYVQDRDPVPRLGMGFFSVGTTYAIRGNQLQAVEKDGLGDWDLFTAFNQGDSTAHLIGLENPNGYLSALKNVR